MKLGFNMKTGLSSTLTSGRSSSTPAPGSFRLGLDPNGTKQLVIWRRGDVYWRSGPWRQSSSDFLYFPARESFCPFLAKLRLSDSAKRKVLNWKRRFVIIEGIAQGLLYLHKFSRLRVIHRDLKASNILLDDEMKPKISDFGMARIFDLNESQANTNRVVGTYGYMSPEYAFHGLVSVKTDVFSFGVLLLEIVSGRKNSSFHHPEQPLNLLGYAWRLWNEDRAMELVDSTMDEEFRAQDQILRCINIGLLCIQDLASDRPTMSDALAMLSSDSMAIPKPKQPAFFISSIDAPGQAGVPDVRSEGFTINVSITELEAR